MDVETTLHDVKESVREFCEVREWEQFHDAKELTTAMILVHSPLEIFK